MSLTNVQLPTIEAQDYEGQTGDPITGIWTIRAVVLGDIASLAGNTLFVVVNDSDQVVASAAIFTPVTVAGIQLSLFPKQANPQPGRYTGPFQVSVCLDAQCTRALGGTPISVSYDTLVLPGLKADLENPTVLSASPNIEVRRTVNVSLPQGVTSWSATIVNAEEQVGLEASATSPTTLQLIGKASPSGTYFSNVHLQASATKPNGMPVRLSAVYGVTYTVR